MAQETLVGIDVAKAWLDGVVLPSGAHRRVANAAPGWDALVAWLQTEGVTLVALEASGGYEVDVATVLDAAGLPVAVLNPLVVRRFAQSLGQRAKTDRVDAAMLAR